MQRQNFKLDIRSIIVSAVVLSLFLLVMYLVVGGIFTILKWLSPVLIILALIIDYETVLNYGKWIGNLFRKQPVNGIVAVVLTLFLYPFVFAYLLTRAFMKSRYKRMMAEYEEEQEGEYVDFEEIEEEPLDLNLPPRQREPEIRQKKGGSEYDNLFE